MQYTATVTSKRQLTLPSEVYRLLGLEKGSKVIITMEDRMAKIEPSLALIDKLAGSLTPPPAYQGLSIDQMIVKAKKEYFGSMKKRSAP